MQHIAIYFFGILLTTSYGHSDNIIVNTLRIDTTITSSLDTSRTKITGLERKDKNQVWQTSGSCISVVEDNIDYMPTYTRISKHLITNSEIAWEEIKSLYPDFAKGIKCWTEYNGYYVFSVGFNDPKTDCMFWHILYVKKRGKEFRYFWPHT